MNKENNQKKKKSGTILIIVILICCAVIAFSAYNLISLSLKYQKGQKEYSQMREYTTVKPTDVPQGQSAQEQKQQEAAQEDTQTQDEVKNLYPDSPLEVDAASLAAVNSDYIGWLYLPAEDISYPVVKSADNEEYIHTGFEGGYLYAGCLFMDHLNNPGFDDPNTIIYGHNMNDGSMFGRLQNITEHGSYNEQPYFWIIGKDYVYTYQIAAIFTTYDTSDVYQIFSGPSEEFAKWITECFAQSVVPFDPPAADQNSKIITLSTCTSGNGTGRLVLQGLLVEKEPVG